MASAEITVTVRADARLALAWLWMMTHAAPILGRDRAYRWGVSGAHKLMLVKVGDRGCWHLGVPRD